ncbi:MAG: hypothetical protein NTZ26_13770 [Candidatus Aminicenantes bacterium]|nr:hypothetical protein [Candidatus Aminicenantes bacterium]
MGHSGIVDWLYRLIPFRAVKARLAEHAERCPVCAKRLAGRDEVRRIFVRAADLGRLDDIWPAVRRRSSQAGRDLDFEPVPVRNPGPRLWRYAVACLGFMVAAGLTVSVVRYFGTGSEGTAIITRAEESFEIHYARIQQKPAATFVVHSPGDGMVLVWVEKNL